MLIKMLQKKDLDKINCDKAVERDYNIRVKDLIRMMKEHKKDGWNPVEWSLFNFIYTSNKERLIKELKEAGYNFKIYKWYKDEEVLSHIKIDIVGDLYNNDTEGENNVDKKENS